MVKAQKLLDKCFEIEGLLALLIQRNDDVPDQLFQLLEEKVETMYLEVSDLRASKQPTDNSQEDLLSLSSELCYENANIEPNQCIEQINTIEEEQPVVFYEETNPIQNQDKQIDEIAVFDIEQDCANPVDTIVVDDTTDFTDEVVESVSFQIKLSVNDQYRFRRELFNYSDEEMNEALDALSQMNSVEEVEDYFYNDLCWEPDEEVVKEFMSMIKMTANK